MKPKIQKSCLLFTTLSACPAILAMVFTHGAMAAAYTWDGVPTLTTVGPPTPNWNPDSATDVATGDTLTFAGTTLLTPYNDISGLTLANTAGATAFTFASGAGAFVLSGNAVTVGLTTVRLRAGQQPKAQATSKYKTPLYSPATTRISISASDQVPEPLP